MSTILSDKQNIKAKKQHRCCFCHDLIESGELYNKRSIVSNYGDFNVMKMHPECDKYAQEHWEEDWEEDISDKCFDRPERLIQFNKLEDRNLWQVDINCIIDTITDYVIAKTEEDVKDYLKQTWPNNYPNSCFIKRLTFPMFFDNVILIK